MKSKKWNTMIMTAVVTAPLLIQTPAFAEVEISEIKPIMAIDEDVQQVNASNFIKVSGIVSKINKDNQSYTLIVENGENTRETHFPISEEVLIFNSGTTEQTKKESITEGAKVEVYYDRQKPILMIYPAVIPPEIVIVHDEEKSGQVKVALFDEDFVSLDNSLKLNITEDTSLLNEKGENISISELSGKELVVFYTNSTKSIPAQTAPSKVVAYDIDKVRNDTEKERNDTEKEQNIEESQVPIVDSYLKENEKMVPVRKVAESLGYKVEWHAETEMVTIQNDKNSFTLSIGKESYSLNDSLQSLKVAPELKDGKTYVSAEIIQLLNK